MLPFLHGRRPVALRPQVRQQSVPPRQPIVPLEIDDEPLIVAIQRPTGNGPALLSVKAIRDGCLHDVFGPVWSGELRPMRLMAQTANAAKKALPECAGARHHRPPAACGSGSYA